MCEEEYLNCYSCGYKRLSKGSTSSLCLACLVSLYDPIMIPDNIKEDAKRIERIKEK